MALPFRIRRHLIAAIVAVPLAAVVGLLVWVVAAGKIPLPHLPSQWLVALIAAIAIAAVLVIVYFQRQWLAPLDSLTRALNHLAHGEWQTRIEPRGADALHSIAMRLNAVASQAQRQLSDLQNQRADLQRLVDTLPDPILACDSQGRIILTNFPAATLLQVSPAQALRQRVVNVVTDAPILELFDLLQKSPRPAFPHDVEPSVQQEIRLYRGGQKLVYQAMAARTIDQGVLLVFRDVSRITGATQMKTDFVANASHELRTPIAAIKIAFETLREVMDENDRDQADRCMTIIDGHLHRLEEMLRDLLDLSRVESPLLETHTGPVKTVELFANLRATLGVVARQKNVTLFLDERGSVLEFDSDLRLLNLILKNLVENSLKFTPANGSVSVRIAPETPNFIELTVIDTGIGIAPEHVDRVFERFYQVDAARSGSAGRGTGLGLAIVKHAVLAMKGNISLQSTPGGGTTVTCRFPQGQSDELNGVDAEPPRAKV